MKKGLLGIMTVILLSAMISCATGSGEDPGSLKDETWPDLPVAIKSGIGVMVDDVIYVGLGSAGSSFFALDLKSRTPVWEEKSAFPGPVPTSAAAAASGKRIYVFGGNGKETPEAKAPILFDTVYSYDIKKDRWDVVDTVTPAGLLGASAYACDTDSIAFFGGYNKEKFDKYLSDIKSVDKNENPDEWNRIVDDYMGMEPDGYEWNKKVLVYNTNLNSWSDLGDNPYQPNCGSAIAELDDSLMIINGEIKPGLRTSKVKSAAFEGASITWELLEELPAPAGQEIQEGLAGAFAGVSNGSVIVAGGANFHGAKAQAAAGNWFSHKGLGKAYNPEVYVYTDNQWEQVSSLDMGLAYGSSFTIPEGVLCIGGEDGERNKHSAVFLLSWDGETITIQD